MLNELGEKNITDKWLEHIFLLLDKIDEELLRMNNGCKDIIEYLPNVNNKEALDKICFVNAGLIITKLDLVLGSVKGIILDGEYEDLRFKLDSLKLFYNGKITLLGKKIQLYELIRNDLNKSDSFMLNSNFNVLCNELTECRNELVDCLRDILFLEGNIKSKRKVEARD